MASRRSTVGSEQPSRVAISALVQASSFQTATWRSTGSPSRASRAASNGAGMVRLHGSQPLNDPAPACCQNNNSPTLPLPAVACEVVENPSWVYDAFLYRTDTRTGRITTRPGHRRFQSQEGEVAVRTGPGQKRTKQGKDELMLRVFIREVSEGLRPQEATVTVTDYHGRPEYMPIDRGMLVKEGDSYYLSVPIIHIDPRSKAATIGLPIEADSGGVAHQIWVRSGPDAQPCSGGSSHDPFPPGRSRAGKSARTPRGDAVSSRQ